MNKSRNSHNLTSVLTVPIVRVLLYMGLLLFIVGSNLLPAGFILFIIIITESARIWSKYGLRKLHIKTGLFPSRVFPNEELTLTIEIFNNKLIPINIAWNQPLIPEIRVDSPDATEDEQEITGRRFFGWYDKQVIKYKLNSVERGYYKLPPLQIEAREGLGFYFQQEKIERGLIVIVYPQLIDLEDLELTPADLIGERKANRPLLPDPIRIAGIRDYTPDIPARFINWKASASKGKLLAKVLEPSADLRMCIAIDVESFSQPSPDPEAFEKALSVAASLAFWADNNKVPFGLLANGLQKELSSQVAIPVGSSPTQLVNALEALARLELRYEVTLSNLIKTVSSSFPWGTTLVIIGADLQEPADVPLRNVLYYNIK